MLISNTKVLRDAPQGRASSVDPARLLTAGEVMSRVCDYFQAEHVEPLKQKVA
jgi:hypothetical protein